MGKALCVFKLVNNKEKFLQNLVDRIELMGENPNQNELSEFNLTKKMTQPKSILTKSGENKKFATYSVKQESNTMYDRIKVYKWDFVEDIGSTEPTSVETDRGYQTISNFRVVVDKLESIVYVFATKLDALLVVRRISVTYGVKVEPYSLELAKINEIPHIIDEWGAWATGHEDDIKKHGYFGHKIKKFMEGNEHNITAYLVTWEEGDSQFDLTISRAGRISTKNNAITHDALFKLFDYLREKLKESEPPIS